MVFYVVKGAPDSCGPGCDSWIQADGTIEFGTSGRLLLFLNHLHDRNLPIYFTSPGGSIDQAINIGNLLHFKLAVVGVGRTIVKECGAEPQDSDACRLYKQTGFELHGELVTDGAVCASACVYALAGAVVHEIAPDAVVGVHAVKVVPRPHVSSMRAAFDDWRGHIRSDRMLAAYLTRMSIDTGLLNLAMSVSSEDLHVLTRDEIARFGLDAREFVETPWRFDSDGSNALRKVAVIRRPGEPSFRSLQWRVTCSDADSFTLDFQRPKPANAGSVSVAIAQNGASAVGFDGPTEEADGVERWSIRLNRSRLDALVDHPEVEIIEASADEGGRTVPQAVKLSNEGWAGALGALAATCASPKNSSVVATPSGEAAVK
jgi:hypothetical protein